MKGELTFVFGASPKTVKLDSRNPITRFTRVNFRSDHPFAERFRRSVSYFRTGEFVFREDTFSCRISGRVVSESV